MHVRWQESLAPAARQTLESTFRLTAAERLDGRTWRYELIDPSSENIRSLVRHEAAEDTQGIDRTRYSVDALASRTDRRGRFPIAGNMIVLFGGSAGRASCGVRGAAGVAGNLRSGAHTGARHGRSSQSARWHS